MTDEEELAEKYAKLNARQYLHNDGSVLCSSEEEVKQAFLAGLKDGRPKWHKVADGDLPEYGVEVLDEDGDKVRYEPAGYSERYPLLSGWIAFSENEERDVEIDAPIAWCEVPQYTEETIE